MARPPPGDTPADAAEPARPGALRLGVALAALLVAFGIGVKAYTGHVWEDFLITFRFSENLVAGNGLVYQPGERVFGFTSPLDALLPALFKAVLGGPDYERALWAFAVVSLAVLGGGLVAFVALASEERAANVRSQALVGFALFALNVKLVMNSINGQEAGLWGGFLAMSLYALLRRGRNWRGLGIAAAGLLWTRPDSPVQILMLGLGAFAFAGEARRGLMPCMLKAAALCAALYLPWFCWATAYYGSPVPHTIIAKINMFGGVQGFLPKISAFFRILPSALSGAFKPIYSEAGGWPAWVDWLGLGAGTVCSCYFLMPSADRIGRVASLTYLGSALYLAAVGVSGMIFPWYYVPCSVAGAIVLARIIGCRLGPGAAGMRSRIAAWAALCALLSGFGYEMVYSLPQLRIRQELVENGVRKQVGLWLREHVRPGETVFLEPIGYIGYYSRAHILDYPGLVSPVVVRARREMEQGYFGCIARLKPDWLVLRAEDLPRFRRQGDIRPHYAYAATFDAGARSVEYRSMPGSGFMLADGHLVILRRLPDGPGTPAR